MIDSRIIFFCLFLIAGCSSVHKEITAHREKYKEDFITDPRAPLKEEDLKNLDFYKPNPKARVIAVVRLTPGEQPFELPTYSGITRTYRKWGELRFLWERDTASLAVYQNLQLLTNPVYNDHLFLPFKDLTNGVETYGGGRYLDMSQKDADDGSVILDFNKSYNPWCAYSDGFNCPIPPVENHLDFPVYAGEKQYKGEVKHQ